MRLGSSQRLYRAILLLVCAAHAAHAQALIDPLLEVSETLTGLHAGAGFGLAAATAGDVNGDGYSDVIVGAPLRDEGAEDTDDGHAYVYLGGPGGMGGLPAVAIASDTVSAWLGAAVAPAGDVNGDGYDDVLVGAPRRGDAGAAVLHLGSSSGTASQPAWRLDGTTGSDLGWTVAIAGDVDADGLPDILVGAPRFTNVDVHGKVWIYPGSATSGTGISAAPLWSREGSGNEGFGWSVAGAGDVDADGRADVIVGASNISPQREGRAYLFLSGAGGLPQAPAWAPVITDEISRFGWSVGTAGDVDGDGFSDFVVGDPVGEQHDMRGAAYVYAGRAGTPFTDSWQEYRDSTSETWLGASVATAGDLDGDGYADVVVGEPSYRRGVDLDVGRALVYLGSPTGLLEGDGDVLVRDRDLEGQGAGELFGQVVGSAGDVDGDGFGDLLVAAPGASADATGRVIVYRGAGRLPSTEWVWSMEGTGLGAALGGGALASAGDVNGDGFGDVLVGGVDTDGVDPDHSAVHFFLGSAEGFAGEPDRTFVADGPSAGLGFGGVAGSAGDVNGDGYDDILIGQSLRSGKFPAEGRVRIYSGGPSGLSERPVWVRDGWHDSMSFGAAVEGAGDVNGDGFADVLIGAGRYQSEAGEPVGTAFLFLGSPGGLSLQPAWTALGEQPGALFGSRASTAGDVNADGYSDVLVVAPLYAGLGPDEAKAYLYLGSPAGLPETPAWTWTPGSFSRMGLGGAGVGDVDGNGRTDLILGGIFFGEVEQDAGRAWLFLDAPPALGSVPAWTADGELAFSRFASRLDGPGDLDRDGFTDLVIGEVGVGLVVDRTSRAFVYLGTPDGLTATAAWSRGSPQPGDAFGHVGASGDVNGDGFPDLLVGASTHDGFAGANTGSVYLFLGNGGGTVRRPRQLRTAAATPIDRLGRSDASDSFRIAFEARSPAGRAPVRLEWEAKRLGASLDGTGLGRGALFDTGAPDPGTGTGSAVELVELVGGLAADTQYAWRARLASRNPYFPRSPWLSLPEGGIAEAKVRTAPVLPPATGFLCETIAAGVEIRWQNGDAYEALELRRDGVSLAELAGNETSYFDAAPGAGRHEYSVVGRKVELSSPPAAGATTVRAVETLTAGFETEVVLTPDAPRAWFTFTPRPGSLLRITLSDDDAGDANALYARWGEPARASAFDHAAERRSQASQRLVIPSARAATLSVLAQANVLGGGQNVVRLRAEEVEELALESLSSQRAGTSPGSHLVSAVITGAGFEGAAATRTRFILEERLEGGAQGAQLEAADVVLVSSSRAEAAFDLGGAPAGTYDLEAVKETEGAGGAAATFRARLEAVFTVSPSSRGPLLQVQVGGPQVTRTSRTTHLAVDFANVGDREMLAPLLLVTAPPGGELRLANDAAFRGRRLLVLGAPSSGRPDRLAPGATGSVPIVFRGDGCEACAEAVDPRVGCCAGIEVAVLTPGSAFVGWDGVAAPPGLEAGWIALRAPLSAILGATWLEVHQSLARRARRLARRGIDPHSTLEPFRLAVREALGRPTGAITGEVRLAAGGAPAEDRLVAALAGGAVQAAARTDAQGRFLLEPLPHGTGLELLVDGSSIVAANRGALTGDGALALELPAGDDALGLELEVAAGEQRGIQPACPGCDGTDLPSEPLAPPAELFALASRWEVGLIGSEDPNEKGGSTGPDDILAHRPVVHYTVYFENKPEANAPAQGVRITDRLDADRLDLSTFRIGEVQLGADDEAKSIAFATEGYSAEATVAVSVPRVGQVALDKLDVAVKVDLDLQTGELIWDMRSLTADVFQGFLHPNDASGRGQGAVSFTVSPRNEIPRDDDIRNRAALRFDENAIVETNEVIVPAALFFPEHEPRRPRPADGATQVAVDTGLCWEPVGRAVRYEVAFGKEGDAPALTEVADACIALPPLEHAATYAWQVTAVTAGERRAVGPTWRLTTAPPPPPPAGAARLPIPQDGEMRVSRATALSWSPPAGGTASYAVYLWPAGEPRPAAPLVTGWTATSFRPPPLACGRAYTWQVLSRSSPLVAATPGPEWSFTVRGRPFRRGDADSSTALDITDPVRILTYLFGGGAAPPCLEAADGDASGRLDITDPIYLLGYLFLGTPAPPAPFPLCDCGPEDTALDCAAFPACP